jgi:hypothetical protein
VSCIERDGAGCIRLRGWPNAELNYLTEPTAPSKLSSRPVSQVANASWFGRRELDPYRQPSSRLFNSQPSLY